MSPYQHGEVFVTDDGAETDLDLGHYERFIDINLNKYSNVTSGKVYSEILRKERKGEYLGATVQMVPHVTNMLKEKLNVQQQQLMLILLSLRLVGLLVIWKACHLLKLCAK